MYLSTQQSRRLAELCAVMASDATKVQLLQSLAQPLAQFMQAYPDLVLQANQIDAFKAINGDIVDVQADGTGLVKGIDRVDLSVGARNLFNKEPPLNASGNYLSALHETYGRYLHFGISKNW